MAKTKEKTTDVRKGRRFILGVFYIPPFSYGTYEFKEVEREDVKRFYKDGFDIANLNIEEKVALAGIIGLKYTKIDDEKFQKFGKALSEKTQSIKSYEVGDCGMVVRFAYTDYNTENHEQVWELGYFRRIK